MIHNHHQNTRIRSITDRLCCIVVKEIKIFFNLIIIKYYTKKIKIKGRKRRLVTSEGFVIAIDSRDPNRVKTDRGVLEIFIKF